MSDSTIRTWINRAYWPTLIILVILTVWVFYPRGGVQPADAGTFAESSSEFGGDELLDMCVDHDDVGMHYHFDLVLIVNGTREDVPANIGIAGQDCMKAVHTHDNTGHAHIELPEGYEGNTPTLHDFFFLWGYDLSSTELLGQTGEVEMTLNEDVIRTSENLIEGYRMADGDVITLELK